MKRLPPLVVNLALSATVVALALAGFELWARSWRRRDTEGMASKYTVFDPVLGWRHRPGARADFALGAYAINSLGLRDKERSYRPGPGVERVLILGDSFAEGYNVPFEAAISQVLERTLRSGDCPVEAINGGTVGYSTDQEYLFYRDELWKYEARSVVLLLYYNDILYNARAGVGKAPKPLFSFTGGQPRLKNVPLSEPAHVEAQAPPAEPSGSAALQWLETRVMNGAPRLYSFFARLGLWESLESGEAPVELQVFSRTPPQAVNDAWEFTRHLLRHLNAEVRAHGGRLAVAYVPAKLEVSERAWALGQARFGVDETSWDRRRLARLLKQAGADLGFSVLDLTAALRAADGGSLGSGYHDPGGHWNATGHRVAADQVAGFLRDEGWLDACRGR